MLVKCDKCGQGYDVNESRLSPQGARIKCPSCSHIFLVRLNGGNATVSSSQASAPEKEETQAAPVQAEEETWRIRNIGLTYTFHDLASLRDWLSGRPSLDDVKIAKGEDEWRELGDYPNILTTELITKFFPLGDVPTTKSRTEQSASSTDSSSGRDEFLQTTSGSLPIAKDPVSNQSDLSTVINTIPKKNARQIKQERAKAEEQKKQLNKTVIAFIVMVCVIGAVAIYLLLYFRTGKTLFSEIEEAKNTAKVEAPEIHEEFQNILKNEPELKAVKDEKKAAAGEEELRLPNEAEILALANAELEARFNEAKDMVKNRRWPEARATLETLVKDRPDHLETLQLLQQTYRGLGINDKASELEPSIKRLKAEAKKRADEEKKAAEAAADAAIEAAIGGNSDE